MARRDGDRSVITRHRLGQAAHLGQKQTAIEPDHGIVPVFGDGGVIAHQGFFPLAQRPQHIAEVGQGLLVAGIELERMADRLHRFQEIALLGPKQPQHMLGVEMGRIGGENKLIKRGRIRQPAFLV